MPLSEFRAVLEERLTAWNLPAEIAVKIEERLTPVTFAKGAIVFLRGAPGDLVFWLRKGFVKLYLLHANGNRTLIAVARLCRLPRETRPLKRARELLACRNV
jgi:CRP-like cAMP-binding protein